MATYTRLKGKQYRVRKTLHMCANSTVEELKTGDEVILYFKPLERYDWTDPGDPEPPLELEEIPTILAGSQVGVVDYVMDEWCAPSEVSDELDAWLCSPAVQNRIDAYVRQVQP